VLSGSVVCCQVVCVLSGSVVWSGSVVCCHVVCELSGSVVCVR